MSQDMESSVRATRKLGRPRSRPELEPAILALLADDTLTMASVADKLGIKKSLVRSVWDRFRKVSERSGGDASADEVS